MAEPSSRYMADEHCGPYRLFGVVTLGQGQRAFGCIMMFRHQTAKVGGTILTNFFKNGGHPPFFWKKLHCDLLAHAMLASKHLSNFGYDYWLLVIFFTIYGHIWQNQ